MAKKIEWCCMECVEIGLIDINEDYLSADTLENKYYWGFLAYNDHKQKSPDCQPEPCVFDIEVKDQPR